MDPVRRIVEHTAAVFDCTIEELLGRSRKQPLAEARQAAMWAIRQRYPSLSLMQIGEATGGRHYTTVMHGLTAAEQRAADSIVYREQLQRLLHRVGTIGVQRDPSAQVSLPRTASWWLQHTAHDGCIY
jgi:chromosomal replication initiation ATPase DnaA